MYARINEELLLMEKQNRNTKIAGRNVRKPQPSI